MGIYFKPNNKLWRKFWISTLPVWQWQMPLLDNAVRCSIVSLSGSGWLFPYHLGVLDVLQLNGVLKPCTPIQGLSGGALVAAAIISGVSADEMMDAALNISTRLRDRATSTTTFGIVRAVWGKLAPTVDQIMHEILPVDAWQKCNGRLSVSLTPWPPRSFGEVKTPPKHIFSFTSNDDLIGACLCSAHLPFYMDRHFSRVWRDRRWVDGGMFYDIIPPCPKTLDSSGVIMSCPVEILTRSRKDRHRLICPTPSQFPLRQLFSQFIAPPRAEQLKILRDTGRQNAEQWLAREATMATPQ